MRDQWYGDKRDIIKWGVLVELARRHGAMHILQVLYYRPSSFGALDIDGQSCAVPNSVLRHFRQVNAVSAIQCDAIVEVIDELFETRKTYLDLVLKRLRSRPLVTGIVFLDPDTGLAPREPGPEHVLAEELEAIWNELRSSDLLVFYQHQTNRNGAPWISEKKTQFERAIGLASGTAKVAQAPSIARDVVLFFANKA